MDTHTEVAKLFGDGGPMARPAIPKYTLPNSASWLPVRHHEHLPRVYAVWIADFVPIGVIDGRVANAPTVCMPTNTP